MADSNYVFEEGDPIDVGAHGEDAYLYEGGTPVRNSGDSEFVFQSGTGLGAAFALVYNGTDIGYYETNESHQDFFEPVGTPSGELDAQGLLDAGVPPTDGNYHLTVFAHYSTTEETFGVGGLIWEENQTDSEPGYSITYGEFDNNDGALVAFEGSSASDDIQRSNGDVIHAGNIGSRGNGDATLFRVDGSFTSDISVTTDSSSPTATIYLSGPNEEIYTGKTSISLDISGN